MRQFLKYFLSWMIVLALPMQGIAAAGMMLCGPTHQRMAGVEQMTHSADQHVMNDQQDAHRHDSTSKQDVPSEKYSCSVCAACCAGAMISSSDFHSPNYIFL